MTENPPHTNRASFQPQVLTIQSAVMIGAVGNDAAMPVYTHFRQKAARLDTVRLAAHPGFQAGWADITPASTLAALLRDFANLQETAQPEAIQTGYFGAADQIAPVAEFIADSQKKANIFYLLDPVLGDAGKLYVAQSIADAIQEKLLPLADIITPNAFELGLLAGKKVTSLAEAETAAQHMLAKKSGRLKAVFATGIHAGTGKIADLLITGTQATSFVHNRKLRGVSGSGDVLSALVISAYLKDANLGEACRWASALAAEMIARTASPLGLAVTDLLWQTAEASVATPPQS
ncbi:MAG: PfkB family carbohydrate kinase [Candidatus Puniceispirillaceae bacterium]